MTPPIQGHSALVVQPLATNACPGFDNLNRKTVMQQRKRRCLQFDLLGLHGLDSFLQPVVHIESAGAKPSERKDRAAVLSNQGS